MECSQHKWSLCWKQSGDKTYVYGGRSPREGKTADDKKLDDPLKTMETSEDDHGNNVFGKPSATDSEDIYLTDRSFKDKEARKNIEENAAIKMEEAF